MTEDPIVAEVRAIRDGIAKAHQYDIAALMGYFRKLEAESGREHVTLPPQRPAQQAVAADWHETASRGG